jgi:hypothetical protein
MLNPHRCSTAAFAAILALVASASPALAITYQYTGNPLSGSAPYAGNAITGTVVFDNAQVLPFLGTGGFLAGDSVNGDDLFVESFTFSVGPFTIDSSNRSYDLFQFTFDSTLNITQWEASVEAFLGQGSASFPELIYPRTPGDLAGTDDTLANQSDFFVVGPFATDGPGSWSLIEIPEPGTFVLGFIGAAALAWCWRRRRIQAR